MKGLVYIFVVFLCLSSVMALTGTLEKPKATLRLLYEPGLQVEHSVHPTNPNDIPVDIKLTPIGFDDVELDITETTLQPGEAIAIPYIVNINAPGEYEGGILVQFVDPASSAPGVALSQELTIIAMGEDGVEPVLISAPIESENTAEEIEEDSQEPQEMNEGTLFAMPQINLSGASNVFVGIGVMIVVFVVLLLGYWVWLKV
jgi:hypothetical protein